MRNRSNPPDTAPPAQLNCDLWTGPAPLRPCNPIVHPRGWRAFMEYGNGIVGDMCIHMLDMVRWLLDPNLRRAWSLLAARLPFVALFIAALAFAFTPSQLQAADDWRNIRHGRIIPTATYADQPYIVQTEDGAWLCLVTTGAGHEGAAGQHVISLRSTDQGRTWELPVPLEPASGPEASYAVPLKLPGGRIYAFYNHNTDNLRRVRADEPPFAGGFCFRVDSLGYFVFKFSDDHGRSWSPQRYPIPVREFDIDRENPYAGAVRFFWNVGHAFTHEDSGFVPLHKVGGFGHGFFTRNEGVLLKSPNILSERDPERITWVTLPDGDRGLRTPPGGGPIAAEQSFAVLSDGSFYCVYRSVDGHPVFTYSRDGGHTWDPPQYKRFDDGRLMKHPRAANFVWKCANGKFLYWFHNHGGRTYDDRNPAWLCGGIEADSPAGKIIRWSQPEIVLYDDDPFVRMSYPDLVEEGGRYFITETQKNIARVHDIDPSLLSGLWSQFEPPSVARHGLLLEAAPPVSNELKMPRLPQFLTTDPARPDRGLKDLRTGFTLDLRARFQNLDPGRALLDTRTTNGRGFFLSTTPDGALELLLNDGRTESRWTSDPHLLGTEATHHITVIIDGGPKLILFVVDGQLCDGAESRQFGWGRFSPHLRDANGASILRIGPDVQHSAGLLRLYNRALRVSETVQNHRSGRK